GRLLERVEGPGTPLGGADLFHVRTDAELARRGTNVCVLLATLEGRIDVPALRARLAEGPPELRWRLGRGLRHPWLWRPDGPGAVLVERRLTTGPVAAALALLDEPTTGTAPWRVAVLHGEAHDAVALLWFHAATD